MRSGVSDDGCQTAYNVVSYRGGMLQYLYYDDIKESVAKCDKCKCGRETCLEGYDCVSNATSEFCRIRDGYLSENCPANYGNYDYITDGNYTRTMDREGRCRLQIEKKIFENHHIVPPYQYRFSTFGSVKAIGYECGQETCDCGNTKCQRKEVCLSPGRCIRTE